MDVSPQGDGGDREREGRENTERKMVDPKSKSKTGTTKGAGLTVPRISCVFVCVFVFATDPTHPHHNHLLPYIELELVGL